MKKIYSTLFIVLVTTLQGNAQTNGMCFSTPTNIAVGTNPRHSVVGDFNSDGNADIVIANEGSSNISLLLGNGNGTFGSPTNFPVGGQPFGIDKGDMNNDGKLDIVTANNAANNVSVLLGNGAGNFTSSVTYTTGTAPWVVKIADLNNDNNQDVIIGAALSSSSVSVLLGNGAGALGTATLYAIATEPFGITTNDFNNDGHIDIAVSCRGGNNIGVLLGNSTGSFSNSINTSLAGGPRDIISGDYNNDGKMDVITANQNGSNFSVNFGAGTGTFSAPVNYVAGTSSSFVRMADFNMDGTSDVVVVNIGGNTISVYKGMGGGTFLPQVVIAVGSGPQSVGIADFDGDNRPDMEVANFSSSNASILLNKNSFTITPVSGVICPSASVTFTANGASTYSWSTSAITNTILVNPTVTTTYSLTLTNTVTNCTDNRTVVAVTYSAPVISVNSGSICSGSSFTIIPSGAATYTFQGGNAVVSPTANTSYTVIGTSTAGCVSLTFATSQVTVAPSPNLFAFTSTSVLCQGQTAVLTASGAATYSWSSGPSTSTILISPTVTTSYTVVGSASNGCSSSASITQSVSTCAGISVNQKEVSSLLVYPNPFESKLMINGLELNETLEVYNSLGALVYKSPVTSTETEVNLGEQPIGIYFIKTKTITKKVVKE